MHLLKAGVECLLGGGGEGRGWCLVGWFVFSAWTSTEVLMQKNFPHFILQLETNSSANPSCPATRLPVGPVCFLSQKEKAIILLAYRKQ